TLPPILKFDSEARALLRLASYSNDSTKTWHTRVHDEQTEPEPAVIADGNAAFERLEDAVEHFRQHSDAVIFDFEQCLSLMFTERNDNRLPVTELDRI